MATAAVEPLGFAEACVRTKCGRQDMQERCRRAGVVFQPMIFERLGEVSAGTERANLSIN